MVGEEERSELDTSYRRVQQFLKFQEDLKSIEPFDVVVDGANIGFMNANVRLKTGFPVTLSTKNIQLITDALREREMKPLVVSLTETEGSRFTDTRSNGLLSISLNRTYRKRSSCIWFEKGVMMIGIGCMRP